MSKALSNLQMPENKKHHYVPKLYLRRFSETGKSIGLINVPNKLVIENANLKNQCYRDYLYGKDPVFEKTLSTLESEFSNLFLMIDEYHSLPPPLSDEHQILAYCLLLQQGRTKYAADALDEMNDKMFKAIHGEQLEKEQGINLEGYLIGVKDAAKYSTGMHLQFYPIVMDLGYKLLKNNTKKDFITSDNPVVKYNPLLSFLKHGSNTGLGSKGLIMLYPSSPELTMIFYDKEVYRVGSDSKYLIEIEQERDVEQLNVLQASACYENVYFRENNFGSDALIKKASRYRRHEKSIVKRFAQSKPYDEKRSEIIVNSGVDVIFEPSLSFVGIRKSAKRWRVKMQKLKSVPAGFVRNETLMKEQESFIEVVKSKKYEPHEFVKYLKEKYKRANNSMQPIADATPD